MKTKQIAINRVNKAYSLLGKWNFRLIFCLWLVVLSLAGCCAKRDRWIAPLSLSKIKSDMQLYSTNDSIFYMFCKFDMPSRSFFTDIRFLTSKRHLIKFFNVRLFDGNDTLNYNYLLNSNSDLYKKFFCFDSIPESIKFTGALDQFKDKLKYGGSDHLVLQFNFLRKTDLYYEMPKELVFIIDATLIDEQNQIIIIHNCYRYYHYLEKGSVWL